MLYFHFLFLLPIFLLLIFLEGKTLVVQCFWRFWHTTSRICLSSSSFTFRVIWSVQHVWWLSPLRDFSIWETVIPRDVGFFFMEPGHAENRPDITYLYIYNSWTSCWRDDYCLGRLNEDFLPPFLPPSLPKLILSVQVGCFFHSKKSPWSALSLLIFLSFPPRFVQSRFLPLGQEFSLKNAVGHAKGVWNLVTMGLGLRSLDRSFRVRFTKVNVSKKNH